MADYQLTQNASTVIRSLDMAYIPDDPLNPDWIEYQQWVAGGGVPDQPPVEVPSADPQNVALYEHENRLRALEGQPPMTLTDFAMKMKGT